MNKLLLIFVSMLIPLAMNSQEINEIQSAVNACISLRDALAENHTDSIDSSLSKLKSLNPEYFSNCICEDTLNVAIDGMLIFGKSLQNDNYDSAERGQTYDGSILTKTCYVKAGQSSRYTFSSKGHQELAVIAESGGRLTMRIRVTNGAGLDKRFDDTDDVKRGRPQRQVSFDLPLNKKNVVELEIVNCGDKDCMFVVISN